jgi:lysophospholipase L1-like esterase
MNRRHLLTASALGSAAALLPRNTSAAPAVVLENEATILFQGDSITDARRDRKSEGNENQPGMLGQGYPFHIAGQLLAEYPERKLRIFNRGISGNKVPDLAARWQKDCLDLKPTLLSILIGVNDLWHKLNGKYDGTPETYREGFSALLKQTKESLPEVTLVICEPFVTRCGAVNDSWFPEFETRRAIASEVAKEAGAIWVPFYEKFNELIVTSTEPAYWAGDGVHPTHAGHALMAKVWRETVGI